MQQVLRSTWGYEGYVTDNYGAVNGIYGRHHFVNSSAVRHVSRRQCTLCWDFCHYTGCCNGCFQCWCEHSLQWWSADIMTDINNKALSESVVEDKWVAALWHLSKPLQDSMYCSVSSCYSPCEWGWVNLIRWMRIRMLKHLTLSLTRRSIGIWSHKSLITLLVDHTATLVRKLARQAAQESIVLLHNVNDTLPLCIPGSEGVTKLCSMKRPQYNKIAVIGPTANASVEQYTQVGHRQ